MPITKQNDYEIGVNNDIANLSVNVDKNRLGEDKVVIVNDGLNILIKVGSLIEANGSLYAVDTSDIALTRADGYLVFDDAGLAFSIVAAETPELDPERAGYYRPAPSDTQRVTRWDILDDELTINIERQLFFEGVITYLNAKTLNTNNLNVAEEAVIELADIAKIDSSVSGSIAGSVLILTSATGGGGSTGSDFLVTFPMSIKLRGTKSVSASGTQIGSIQVKEGGLYYDVGVVSVPFNSIDETVIIFLMPGVYRLNGTSSSSPTSAVLNYTIAMLSVFGATDLTSLTV